MPHGGPQAMTTAELARQLQEAEARFYAWTIDDAKPDGRNFRCHHQPNRMLMSEDRCRARAANPACFRADCAGCPRWRYYRKLAKKPSRKIAQNYPRVAE